MFEIERRFLVHNPPLDLLTGNPARIRQTYFDNTGDWTIRARLTYDPENSVTSACMTMKRLVGHGIRIELEETIQTRFYNEMLNVLGAEIIKDRYSIPHHKHTIELDFFQNPELSGIIIAEIELNDINESVSIPDWFGEEITDQAEYTNAELFKRLQR